MDNFHHLRLVNWNGQSVLNKQIEFFDFLLSHDIDIGVVTETWLRPTSSFIHPVFSCVRFDRHSADVDRGGGVMIAVRKGFKFSQFEVHTKVIEACGIAITAGDQVIHVIATYFPGERRCSSWQQFKADIRLLTSRNVPYFVVGDLNARHRKWNCLRANKAGTTLAREADIQGFFIHYPDTSTFHPRGRGRPSTLDLVISNNLLDMTKPSTINELSSDHFPVTFEIKLRSAILPSLATYRCYSRADWQKFQQEVNSKIDLSNPSVTALNCEADVDRSIYSLNTIIQEAEVAAIPSVPSRPYQAAGISDDTKLLIRLRNVRRRQWMRTRDPFLGTIVESLNSRIRKECDKARFGKFQHTLQTMERGSDTMWKITKALRKECKYSPPLRNADTLCASPAEKARLLAESFASSHINTMPSDPGIVTSVQRSVEHIDQSIPDPHYDWLVRPKDVTKILSCMKTKKAPGHDRIRNCHLKHLPRKAVIVLAKIFSACLKLCYFPSCWKQAIVVGVPKPKKDNTMPSNYRPISLLPTISKVFERIILGKIEQHIENHPIIPNEQFGFKRGHSTCHQLVRLVNEIRTGFTLKKSSGLVLLDVEKAYDSVWQEAILHKMSQAEFPLYILKLIRSYLLNRSFRVSVNGFLSEDKPVPFGVPQGSVLSPTLFNIFTADIIKVDGVTYYLFADDTGFVATDMDPEMVICKLQHAQNELEKYYERWKIKLNPNKSQVMFFTRRRSPRYLPQREISVNGHAIEWSNNVQYLGLNLDKKLTFGFHIEESLRKFDKLTKTFYPLVNRRSRLDNGTKVLLYKTVFRPTVTYGFPAWYNCASCHRKKVQRKQNRTLKMMLNLGIQHPTDEVHRLAGVEPIDEWFQRLMPKFRISCQASINPLLQNLAV